MGDIALAGTTTDELVNLPSTEGGLIEFLKDTSLPIIWNYIVCLIVSSLLLLSFFFLTHTLLFFSVEQAGGQCEVNQDCDTNPRDTKS